MLHQQNVYLCRYKKWTIYYHYGGNPRICYYVMKSKVEENTALYLRKAGGNKYEQTYRLWHLSVYICLYLKTNEKRGLPNKKRRV